MSDEYQVFEHEKKTEVDYHTDTQKVFPSVLLFGSVDPVGENKVDECGARQKEYKHGFGLHIEEVASGPEQYPSVSVGYDKI